jgi:hypothetical protein
MMNRSVAVLLLFWLIRELELMIWQSPLTHDLIREANLFALYSKFNRGGQVDEKVTFG